MWQYIRAGKWVVGWRIKVVEKVKIGKKKVMICRAGQGQYFIFIHPQILKP